MTKNNSSLRVISGKYRGQVLASPNSEQTHPMGAREKLALFNMVNVEQAKVLDAYAGSGALGIEAYSRGAKEVVFVEKSPKVSKIIQQNLVNLRPEIQLEGNLAPEKLVFITKIANFLQNPEYKEHFDVILADPPYDQIDLTDISALARVLRVNGILALSSPANAEAPDLPELRLSSTHTYARARISIYYKEN